jgi:hypothetical protein
MIGQFEWYLDNWIRYCRKRDWLPLGHVSQIALLIKQAKQVSQTATDAPIPAYEDAALKFNDLVLRLPNRLRVVFLLNHLDKGVLGQRIVYTRHAHLKYRLANVSKATFHRHATEADAAIKRWIG